MGSNQSYIEKADLSISNLTSEGGLLVQEQVKEFFEIVILNSVLLPMCTTVTMAAPTWELSKIGFTGRVLRRGNESNALPLASRSKPELGKTSLSSHEFVAEVRIPYNVVEDNVANGTFPQLVMTLLGKAVARDVEEFVIRADTASADPEYAEFDGILKQAVSFVVNAGGVRLSKTVFKQMLQTMPSQFLTPNMAFLSSKNAVIDYVDSLSNRQTPKGDDALLKAAAAEYMGYPVIPIPIFPENIGTGSTKTNVLLLDPKNINVGFHRQVRIETDRDISARQLIVVVTVRFDTKYSHEPAVVKATEVLATAGP